MTKILPLESERSKTTVMNKVHQIAEEIPLDEKEKKNGPVTKK